MSYGELTLPPVWTGINKQNGQFLKGHVPANKGKKWSDCVSSRGSLSALADLYKVTKDRRI